jgi:hypothetical protein
MTRRVRELRDLIIDEISLVDRGANQHAAVTIAKSASGEEEQMEIFDEQGNPLDPEALADGAIVFDENGDAYRFELEDAEEEVVIEEDVREPVLVGKSANPFARPQSSEVRKSLAEEVREELSKALTDKDRDEVISKALGRIDELATVAKRAEERAEAERVLRLQREYTEVAKAYNVPVAPGVLGPVLMRMAESMSRQDCEVIAKCLDAVPDALFDERGYAGGGDNSDVFTQVSAQVDQLVSKGAFSREEAIASVFEANPSAYDEYLAGN